MLASLSHSTIPNVTIGPPLSLFRPENCSSFKRTIVSFRLDRCIEHAEEAVSCCPPASLEILSRSLLSKYEERGEPSNLEKAIGYAQEAVSLCHAGHSDRPRALGSVTAELLARYGRIEELENLLQSTSLSCDTLKLYSSVAPLRPALLSTLVPAFITMSAREGE